MAFSIFTTNKSNGGMNLPDIKNYYYASILDQMKYWLISPKDKLWLNIEKESTKSYNSHALAIANFIVPKVITHNLLSIKATSMETHPF